MTSRFSRRCLRRRVSATAAAILLTGTWLTEAIIPDTLIPQAEAMKTYQWRNRPLLVFAPSSSDPRLKKQQQVVSASRAGFKDRDMVIVYITGSNVSAALGPSPGMSAAALRKRYSIGQNDFRAILVGKDGGTKKSSSNPLSAGQLFPLIDAMPMRQQELRSR
ncbi:MAG: DUF4174 domain-containing protein [Pseudomonadota bacterium]